MTEENKKCKSKSVAFLRWCICESASSTLMSPNKDTIKLQALDSESTFQTVSVNNEPVLKF